MDENSAYVERNKQNLNTVCLWLWMWQEAKKKKKKSMGSNFPLNKTILSTDDCVFLIDGKYSSKLTDLCHNTSCRYHPQEVWHLLLVQ